MNREIEYEQAREQFRTMAIETWTQMLKRASGYAATDHGIDHWHEAASMLFDTMREMIQQEMQEKK